MGLLAREVTATPSVTEAGRAWDRVAGACLFPPSAVVYRRFRIPPAGPADPEEGK